MKYWSFTFLFLLPCIAFSQKIAGVNLESPRTKIGEDYVNSTKRIAANWVAIIPFAFMKSDQPEITYNEGKNWWGSTPEGIINTVKLARQNDQKILLKPHFWVEGQGWAGDLSFNKWEWKIWEENYSSFILKMAHMADSLQIDMLCVGVELKSSVTFRPKFWKSLIPKIREVYQGELIYSSNWDNYKQVPFWNLVDYIGIDAYFPLSSQSTPSKPVLLKRWKKWERTLSRYAASQGKPILFTEIGYRSINKGAGNQWETENLPNNVAVNLTLQKNAYAAFFETFWKKSWFAGAFLWEWHPYDHIAGGENHSNFSPQHKPAEKVIKQWYSQQ